MHNFDKLFMSKNVLLRHLVFVSMLCMGNPVENFTQPFVDLACVLSKRLREIHLIELYFLYTKMQIFLYIPAE